MKKILKIMIYILCAIILILKLVDIQNSYLLIAAFITSVSYLNIDFKDNIVKNSIFKVTNSGKINQMVLLHPKKIKKYCLEKNKKDIYISECKNMLDQLPRENKKGNIIKYQAFSHDTTRSMLMVLERNNVIENLKIVPKKKKNLAIEKLGIGNTKKLFKKYQFYNMTFNIKTPLESNKKTDIDQSKLELLSLKEELENFQKQKIKIK